MTLTYGREKRLLLGVLALVAPLPLPFNELVGWPTLVLYAAAVGLFLHRARRDERRWLPLWASNFAAVAYLPVFLFDLEAAMSGVVVRPVLRLGLFTVAVKLFSLRRERDKWHALFGIFFLFLASVATSVHLAVAVYLLVFLALVLLALGRFALLHLLAGFGWREERPIRVPLGRFVAAVTVATAVLAVPLFAAIPRVSTPFVRGPIGGGGRGGGGATGYSDQVDLDSIGRLRENREVALRLDFAGPPPAELRLKGGTYERFRGGRWLPSPYVRRGGEARRESQLTLSSGTVVSQAQVFRMPLAAASLPLPVETLRVRPVHRNANVDRGGGVHLARRMDEQIEYTVELAARPVSAAVEPEVGSDAATLDLAGVTPEMIDLAATVAGTGPLGEKARRLERYLIDNYEYTLDLVGRPGDEAIQRFLFDDRRGHCEYFASALVLLLRSQGIHARLVTGFLGAERNTLGLHVVRQSNAHAWVEAWLPGEGWQTLDPTPPSGRPGAEAGVAALQAITNLYDALVFQWDRYVLGFDGDDQADTASQLLARLLDAWRSWTGGDDEVAAAAAGAPLPGAAVAAPSAAAREPFATLAAGAVLLALAAAVAWGRLRRPPSASAAYRRLRRRLAAAGLGLGAATGPLAVARAAAARWSAAAAPAERIVALYVKESFGGARLDDVERSALAPALAELRRALRQRPA